MSTVVSHSATSHEGRRGASFSILCLALCLALKYLLGSVSEQQRAPMVEEAATEFRTGRKPSIVGDAIAAHWATLKAAVELHQQSAELDKPLH